MSRWTEAYTGASFQDTWRGAQSEVDALELPENPDALSLQEMARLKKATAFLNEIVATADPELMPLNMINNVVGQAGTVKSNAAAYKNNKSSNYLQTANNSIDNILTYLVPYITATGRAAQSAGRASRRFANLIEEGIEQLTSSIDQNEKQASTKLSSIDTLKKEAESNAESIAAYSQELLIGSTDSTSIKAEIENIVSQAGESLETIEAYKSKLTVGSENENSIVQQVQDAKSAIDDLLTDASVDYSNTEKELSSLKSFHQKVFGYQGEDGHFVGGLDKQIQDGLERISYAEDQHLTKYESLEGQIEGLLPGATTAGLATSYSNMKNSFDQPIKRLSALFYFALCMLFILSVGVLVEEIGLWYVRFPTDPTVSSIARNILVKAPLSIPLIWLAIFASRRRAENKRLQQEYAHKETVTMSYQGFREQASQLPAVDADRLRAKLLEEAIDSVGHNPSVTLDGKPSDDFPTRPKMM